MFYEDVTLITVDVFVLLIWTSAVNQIHSTLPSKLIIYICYLFHGVVVFCDLNEQLRLDQQESML